MKKEIDYSVFVRMFKGIHFSPDQLIFVQNSFKKIEVKKGDILLSPGQEVDVQYYVASGCLRSFSSSKTGKDYTFMFGITDWWISDYSAYFTDKLSAITIECIQDATIYYITKSDIQNLYKEIPETQDFFRQKMGKAFGSFQRRIIANLSQSARERYEVFIKTYPNIERLVKNYHISSYLGITTESLSRIRKEVSKKKI